MRICAIPPGLTFYDLSWWPSLGQLRPTLKLRGALKLRGGQGAKAARLGRTLRPHAQAARSGRTYARLFGLGMGACPQAGLRAKLKQIFGRGRLRLAAA